MNDLKSKNQYFKDNEYEVFTEENQKSIKPEVMSTRKIIKDKLLNINDDIIELIKDENLNLHNHYVSSKLVSSLVPNQFNKGMVNWLGIRLGRSKSELALLNFGLPNDDDDILGFQKYTCIQMDLTKTGYEVGIFHSVPYDGVDRAYTHQRLNTDPEFKHKLVNAIRNLQGYGLVWNIYDTTTFTLTTFDIDDRNPEDFIQYYDEFDKEGCYSNLMFHFPKYDERIQEDRIVCTTFQSIKTLYELYSLLKWEPKR